MNDIIQRIADSLQDTYLDDVEGIKPWTEYAEALVADLGAVMTAEDFFSKREAMAERYGTSPRDVPAEAVWYLYDGPITDADVKVAKALAEQLGVS